MEQQPENEIQGIIKCAKDVLPDFQLTKDNLLHPKHEFLVSFYQEVMNWLKDRFTHSAPNVSLMEFEQINLENKTAQFTPEFQLFAEVCYLFEMMGLPSTMGITDFYRPNAKRTKFFIKTMINFLVFVQENLEDSWEIVQQCFNLVKEKINLRMVGYELKKEADDKAEELALEEFNLSKLKKDLVAMKPNYNAKLEVYKMQKDIKEKNKRELERVKELYEQRKQLLEAKKARKQEHENKIVSEEKYKTMKTIEEDLQRKLSDLEKDDPQYDTSLEYKKTECKNLKNTMETIESFVLEPLFILIRKHAEQMTQLQQLESVLKEKRIQLQELESNHLKLKSSVENLGLAKQKRNLQHTTVKKGITNDIDQLLATSSMNNEHLSNTVRYLQRVEQERLSLHQDFEDMVKENDKDVDEFTEKYKSMLNAESEVFTAINEALSNILKDC